LQDECIGLMDDPDDARARKDLELYIRYQASHDRAYQRYAAELRKFQAELKKAEIGFESQKRREAQDVRAAAQETRRENGEKRRQEHHESTVSLNQARLEYQQMQNRKLAGEVPVLERSQKQSPETLRAA
jgi:hypothetical protein